MHCLQGPESDAEEECEFTVTELKERARKQREELEKRMMGAGSDDEQDDEEENGKDQQNQSKRSKEDSGCSWGMGEQALIPKKLNIIINCVNNKFYFVLLCFSFTADDAVAEDEDEENPFSTEFHEDQEAAYLKDPKKALQGFYDREGLTLFCLH